MTELNEEMRQAVNECSGKPMKCQMYDDSPWAPEEMATLAAAAFGKDDDTDYSGYLREQP